MYPAQTPNRKYACMQGAARSFRSGHIYIVGGSRTFFFFILPCNACCWSIDVCTAPRIFASAMTDRVSVLRVLCVAPTPSLCPSPRPPTRYPRIAAWIARLHGVGALSWDLHRSGASSVVGLVRLGSAFLRTMSASETPANVATISSPDMFMQIMQQDLDRVTLLNFWAPWAQPCEQMNKAVVDFASRYPQVLFMNIEAEEQPDVAESFDVEAVPTVVLLRGHTLLGKISGANVPAVLDALAAHANAGAVRADGLSQSNAPPQAAPSSYQAAGGVRTAAGPEDALLHELPAGVDVDHESPQDTERRCHELMNRSKVMLFMKGHPNMPRCGFSQKTVALLREQNIDFDHYDILSDENVRQTLKKINEWPTFPQIIVNGELIGGLDIVKVRPRTDPRSKLPRASLRSSSNRSRDSNATRPVGVCHDECACARWGRPRVQVVPLAEDERDHYGAQAA